MQTETGSRAGRWNLEYRSGKRGGDVDATYGVVVQMEERTWREHSLRITHFFLELTRQERGKKRGDVSVMRDL